MYRADKIRSLAAAKNWTRAQLAQQAGLTRQAVGPIYNGTAKAPELATLAAIARALSVPLAAILIDETVEGSAQAGAA